MLLWGLSTCATLGKKNSLANKIAKTEGPKNIPGNICSLFQPNKSHPLWYSHNTYLIKSTGKERNFCWNAQRCSEKRPQTYPQFLVYVTTQYSTTESNTTSKGLNTRLVSTKTVRTGNSDYATPPQNTHCVYLTVQVQLPFSSCTSLMETEQHNSSRSGSNQTCTIKKTRWKGTINMKIWEKSVQGGSGRVLHKPTRSRRTLSTLPATERLWFI